MILTENQLDEWVRGNARDAQGVIVELIWRLVAASCPAPLERRFPLGDSIGQHGPDGVLHVNLSFDPFVPEGRSFWEVGTGLKAGDKATADYNGLVEAIPENIRRQSSFVFVTPLSGRRDWEHTWKEDSQGRWLEDRIARGEWAEVRIIDGTKLIDWICQFPAVELWLANIIIGLPQTIETPDQRWNLIRSIGEPPSLMPRVFLTGRDEACSKIHEIFVGNAIQLKLSTRYPDQVVDFVSAYLAEQGEEFRADAAGRCLVVSTVETWKALSAQREKLFLIADSGLDLSGASGTKLIQMARRAGHAVIFGGAAGGIPDPASASLHNPRSQDVKEALTHSGYGEERARSLAQKCAGNLGSLLRCLQNLSLMPEWAEGSVASELAVAMMLGAWADECSADRTIVENLTGKCYGEWIESMRVAALASGTPLIHQYGDWKFSLRFEGWYALGPRIFDEHLDRFRAIAVSVFTEADPQFDLPVEQRYAAAVHGKVLLHSQELRRGLAETLALVGNHAKALISCKPNKAEATASNTVYETLSGAGWIQWASLGDLLPLFAEAAPSIFLKAVEDALAHENGPFEILFRQEGGGITGRTYISALLWSLETLAWDPIYLNRAVYCLAELCLLDSGGQWANRPANSLRDIFLPWYPQTCASLKQRYTAVSLIVDEQPVVGWRLLLALLPSSHSSSSGTRKPEWRETIPDDWADGVKASEYHSQVLRYADMLVDEVASDPARFSDVLDCIECLPIEAGERFLSYLEVDAPALLSEDDIVVLWNKLVDVISKHRRFIDSEWAMSLERINRIADTAEKLSPTSPAFIHRRLFSERDFDFYEEGGSFEEKSQRLSLRRENALAEIEALGGYASIINFSLVVKSSWRVGLAYGKIASGQVDLIILPDLISSSDRKIVSFVEGFVLSRFNSLGWSWVDKLDLSKWTPFDKGVFLSYLPFNEKTWEYVARLLASDDDRYWRATSANFFEESEKIDFAIDKLIINDRPNAALRCIGACIRKKSPFNPQLAVKALLTALRSDEPQSSIDSYQTTEVIKALQRHSGVSLSDIVSVEWAYLPLLDKHSDASPIFLWKKLAQEPDFFCEVIRLVFKPKNQNETDDSTPLDEGQQRVATNAYRLLNNWQHLPGLVLNDEFDGDFFKSWVSAVKEMCTTTGHLEVAMSMTGHCLIYAPQDLDGLWIHRSVATVLNAKDAEPMRDGYRAALYNQRGAHWVDPTGAGEKLLAEGYRSKASDLEEAGYHRLSTSLREMAESYDREAEFVVARSIKRDL
ncbi:MULTISPECIES: hypothetical protein [unclassified Pseudomonas]|uniref:hypothetical protein n=1 Tax=unclassified Pseudomonas TaxID=196821 RepID=UPI000CD1B377|nr:MULTISPECIES: hypothetical protein [unclassified Pseudomonas]POA13261.1 hypothetical protein C1892_16780 [Pseudomonas sp. MPBD7-1]